MHPYDAFLHINIYNNNNSVRDSLFLIIKSATLQAEEGLYSLGHRLYYPFQVMPGSNLSFYIPTVADEPLFIYWSWDKMDEIKPAPLRDQLVISKGDTLIYSISN